MGYKARVLHMPQYFRNTRVGSDFYNHRQKIFIKRAAGFRGWKVDREDLKIDVSGVRRT